MIDENCGCDGIDFDINGLVAICPERNTCKRYLERETRFVQADGLCGAFEGEFNMKIEVR